jgi:hypothetical protein
MKLFDLINKYWNEVFVEKVVYMSVYKFERSKKYPSIGPINWKFWITKRTYQEVVCKLNNMTKEALRNEHNKRVQEKYKPKTPNGA